MEEDREQCAPHERLWCAFAAQVDPEGVEEAVGDEVREGEETVAAGDAGDVGVLVQSEHDGLEVEPEESDGERDAEEHEDGAVEGEGDEGEVVGAESLAAHGLHAHGEAGEDRVSGDVGEADGEGAASELGAAEAAHAYDGDEAAEVAYEVDGHDGEANVLESLQLIPNLHMEEEEEGLEIICEMK